VGVRTTFTSAFRPVNPYPDAMGVGIIGLGRLGTALARGLDRAGIGATVHNRTAATADALASEHARLTAADATTVFTTCDPVFLWTAPPDAASLAAEHAATLAHHEPLVVTCAPGWTPTTRRWAVTLPNVNLATGQGSTLLTWGPDLTESDKDSVRVPLAACGDLHEVTPDELRLYGALTSSGPALYARAMETWADALSGRHGLDPALCRRMVRQAVAGTLALQDADAIDAADIVDRVAHPGGVTAQGLAVLDAHLPAIAEDMLRAMGKWDR
jgi:pyrroline-5-carboxylate reductase